MVVAGGLQLPNENGNAQTSRQCHGKSKAIMRVELQFRQQVSAGNAEKGARTKCQSAAEPRRMFMGPGAGAQEKQHCAQRGHTCEQQIDPVS